MEPTTKKRQALENAYLAASSEPDPVKRMASISGLNEVSRRSLTTRFGIQTFGQTNVRGAINNNIQNEARRTYTARRTRWDAQRAAFIATTADPAALAIWEANNPPPTDPFAPRP